MKNPCHPGELIRENLVELGMAVKDAAKGLGFTRQQLYNVMNNFCRITPKMALRLEKALGGSAVLWLQMQVNYDLALASKHEAKMSITRFRPARHEECALWNVPSA
jgi:addiction module HigA family antidote